VSDQPSGTAQLDEATVAAFADHLEAFAATLPEPERDLLAALLLSAMDPLDRMRLRQPGEVLTPTELAALRALEAQPEQA
jgi:hypothetical protein